MTSPRRLARIAGLCYLVVAIFGGFAHLYVRARVYVPGDAATTAANVAAVSLSRLVGPTLPTLGGPTLRGRLVTNS